MWLAAKILSINELLTWIVSGTEKAPARCRGFLDLYFNCIGLTITKNHFGESFILLMGMGLLDFCEVGGLDTRFC